LGFYARAALGSRIIFAGADSSILFSFAATFFLPSRFERFEPAFEGVCSREPNRPALLPAVEPGACRSRHSLLAAFAELGRTGDSGRLSEAAAIVVRGEPRVKRYHREKRLFSSHHARSEEAGLVRAQGFRKPTPCGVDPVTFHM
jgi:hypothetical protein